MQNKVLSILLFVVFAFAGFTSVDAQKSKARAQYISLKRSGISPGKENGYDFEKVKFKYQFVTCKGEVKLGVAYDKKANFLQYWDNGKLFQKSQIASKKWPKPEDIRINDITADLYFGTRKLGAVQILYIPEYYKGCSGKMYEVLKQVSLNPRDRVYKTNIDKLSLRNIRVTRSSVKGDL